MLPAVAGLAIWWVSTDSTGALVALAAQAAINLVGGGLSVFPLGWLPFRPEQTASHYTVHVIYAVCQISLLAITTTRTIRRRRALTEQKARGPVSVP